MPWTSALRLFLSLLSMTLLTACAAAVSSPAVIAPDIPIYSGEFQMLLADELEAMPRPCDRIDPQPGCSASKRAVMDYGWLRERVRALTAR